MGTGREGDDGLYAGIGEEVGLRGVRERNTGALARREVF